MPSVRYCSWCFAMFSDFRARVALCMVSCSLMSSWFREPPSSQAPFASKSCERSVPAEAQMCCFGIGGCVGGRCRDAWIVDLPNGRSFPLLLVEFHPWCCLKINSYLGRCPVSPCWMCTTVGSIYHMPLTHGCTRLHLEGFPIWTTLLLG